MIFAFSKTAGIYPVGAQKVGETRNNWSVDRDLKMGMFRGSMGTSGSQWEWLTLGSTLPTVSGANVVFTGTFQRALDGKARVLLPKRMRAELAESPMIFLTPGTDHCLEIHTNETLQEHAQRASQSSAGSKNVKSFLRLFYSQAEQCDIDGQGRIRIPKTLCKYAELDKEIVIVGAGFNWEIWDQGNWNSYMQSHESDFDQIAESTFDQINRQPTEKVETMGVQQLSKTIPR